MHVAPPRDIQSSAQNHSLDINDTTGTEKVAQTLLLKSHKIYIKSVVCSVCCRKASSHYFPQEFYLRRVQLTPHFLQLTLSSLSLKALINDLTVKFPWVVHLHLLSSPFQGCRHLVKQLMQTQKKKKICQFRICEVPSEVYGPSFSLLNINTMVLPLSFTMSYMFLRKRLN